MSARFRTMTETELPHLYGTPDGGDRPGPAPQGMRGTRATLDPESAHPALRRRVALDSGRLVTLVEDSGVGWAEAEGRTGHQARPVPPAAGGAPRPALRWLALAVAGGAVLAVLRRPWRGRLSRRASRT